MLTGFCLSLVLFIKDAERQHREVVSIYRTHLLSAAQVSGVAEEGKFKFKCRMTGLPLSPVGPHGRGRAGRLTADHPYETGAGVLEPHLTEQKLAAAFGPPF